MAKSAKIRIHVLHCGTISVAPAMAYGGSMTHFKAISKAALCRDADRLTLPVCAYLIEHPKGLVLVDTGWCREISPEGVRDDKAIGEILPPLLSAFFRPELKKGQAVHEKLAEMGIKPEDLTAVLLTHLDPDHVSGVRHVLGAKRILLPEDEYFWSCRTVYKARQPWKLWMDYPIEKFFYRGSAIGPNRWAYDVFGDESLYMVSTPGHTDGMGAVLIYNGKRFALLAADNAFSKRSWQELNVPGFGFDEKLQLKSLKWIKQMAEDENCAAVLASHDADIPDGTVIEF